VLGDGCWVLGDGCWVLGDGCWNTTIDCGLLLSAVAERRWRTSDIFNISNLK
jgi:hypothetical protein